MNDHDHRNHVDAREAPGAPWLVPQRFDAEFSTSPGRERDDLLMLYERAKRAQWDASERIDWSIDLDPESPMELPDEHLPLFGSRLFDRMTRREKGRLRHHYRSWQFSQFMHGEQGALQCAAKIVQQSPSLDAKLFAATQVVDEARHHEAYSRLLREKYEMTYPVNTSLKALLDDVLADRRWDMTYLGMQVMVEGLALAAFSELRDASINPLVGSINAFVMQDEARHVAFGRFALRDLYPQLSEPERADREEFVIEATELICDRFGAGEVWDHLGLPADECNEHMHASLDMQQFHRSLFSRVVPILKDIGLWGRRVRDAFEAKGITGPADTEPGEQARRDERIAFEFDERMDEIRATAEFSTTTAG